MMIIRALEKNGIMDAVVHALSDIVASDDLYVVVKKLLGSATKALRLRVEAELPAFVDTLRAIFIEVDGIAEKVEVEEEAKEMEVTMEGKPALGFGDSTFVRCSG
uniref:Uncharacterized protein n=1 Tax=Peronospora matthiolae TaxID=2874970 RepID=A0AAV1SYU0_9STRA